MSVPTAAIDLRTRMRQSVTKILSIFAVILGLVLPCLDTQQHFMFLRYGQTKQIHVGIAVRIFHALVSRLQRQTAIR